MKLINCLSAFLLFLLLCGPLQAKDLTLLVEFSYDPAFEPIITSFRLYYKDNDTAEFVLADEIYDVSRRTFDTPTLDLPPGQTTNFYISAVHEVGEEFFSEVYSWRFTGNIKINKIRKTL